MLELVNADDEVFQRDRRRLDGVVAERRRLASVTSHPAALPGEVDRVLLTELNGASPGALLDVGTGSGHLLGLLGEKATRAVGIDISREALQLARSNVHSAGLSHCELQRGDMYDLPFSSAVFDTATIDRTLAQADKPVVALAEIARTLKSGARLMVIEDFDRLSERSGQGHANPLAILRDWFASAGIGCDRIHPVDTEQGLLLVAVGRRLEAAHAAA
jgi:ArsR family transcriptional regulator